MLPNSFSEANITLILKPDNGDHKKRKPKTNILHEYCCKILSKILVNQIQQPTKKIKCCDHVGLIPGLQVWFDFQKIN